jgi:S1-C subfamily serine protease
VRTGDLIRTIAGQPASSVDSVSLALANARPGQSVPVQLERPDGSTLRVTVKLGQLPGG